MYSREVSVVNGHIKSSTDCEELPMGCPLPSGEYRIVQDDSFRYQVYKCAENKLWLSLDAMPLPGDFAGDFNLGLPPDAFDLEPMTIINVRLDHV